MEARRIKLVDVNPYLMCTLCSGYIIDATTIIECLHSFCKTCIYQYLEANKFCPVCDVQVHKTKPLLNVRPDKTFQALIYKIVPGLYKDEMERRRLFYAKNPEPGLDPVSVNLSDQPSTEYSSISVLSPFETLPEWISLCLELSDRLPPFAKVVPHGQKCIQKNGEPIRDQRHLLCPVGLTVGHLKKFLCGKFDLFSNLHIDIYHSDEILKDVYSLSDIASIYTWRRVEPLKLYYVIYEIVDSTAVNFNFAVKIDNEKVVHDTSCALSSTFENHSKQESSSKISATNLLIKDSKSMSSKQKKTQRTTQASSANAVEPSAAKSCLESDPVSDDFDITKNSAKLENGDDRTDSQTKAQEVPFAVEILDRNNMSMSASLRLSCNPQLNVFDSAMAVLANDSANECSKDLLQELPNLSSADTTESSVQPLENAQVSENSVCSLDSVVYPPVVIASKILSKTTSKDNGQIIDNGEIVCAPSLMSAVEKCGFESQIPSSDVENHDQAKKENRPTKKRSSEIEQLLLDRNATREVRSLYRELAMSSDKHGRSSHLRLRLRTGSLIRRRSIGLGVTRSGKGRSPVSSQSKSYVMRRKLADNKRK